MFGKIVAGMVGLCAGVFLAAWAETMDSESNMESNYDEDTAVEEETTVEEETDDDLQESAQTN